MGCYFEEPFNWNDFPKGCHFAESGQTFSIYFPYLKKRCDFLRPPRHGIDDGGDLEGGLVGELRLDLDDGVLVAAVRDTRPTPGLSPRQQQSNRLHGLVAHLKTKRTKIHSNSFKALPPYVAYIYTQFIDFFYSADLRGIT